MKALPALAISAALVLVTGCAPAAHQAAASYKTPPAVVPTSDTATVATDSSAAITKASSIECAAEKRVGNTVSS